MITRVGAHTANIILLAFLVFTLRFSLVFALSTLSYSESVLRSLSIISSLNSVRKKTLGEKMRHLLLNRQKQNFSPQARSTDSAQRDIKCCCPNLSFWSSANNRFKEISHISSHRI